MKGWKRNLYLTWFAQLLSILGFNFCVPFLPFFVMELGVTDERSVTVWASMLTAAPSILLIVFSPIWGYVADKYGRKPMVSRSMLAGAVAIFLMSKSTSVEQLLLLRLIQGMFTGTIAASMAMVSGMVPQERLGSSLGLMQTAVFCGTSFGPLLGGLAADALGLRTSFLVASGMLLTGVAIIVFFVQENFVRTAGEAKMRTSVFSNLRFMLNSKVLLAMSFTLFATQFSIKALVPIAPLLVKQLSGNGTALSTLSGLSISLTGMTAAISAAYLGKMGDKKGHGKVLLACAVGTSALFLAHIPADSVLYFLVVRALVGFTLGGILPAANSTIGSLVANEQRGRVYGVSSSASYLGNLLGPTLGGLSASYFGLRSVFVLVSVLFIAVVLIVRYTVRQVVTCVQPKSGKESV